MLTLPALSAALILVAPQADEQPLPWNGLDGFVMLLGKCGVQLGTDDSLSNPHMTDGLVILLGEAPKDRGQVRKIKSALKRGAKLLIASDRPSMAGWFRDRGVEFVPGPILVEPRDGFHRAPDCPLVGGSSRHPFFKDVGRVALNRTAAFRGTADIQSFLPVAGEQYGWIWTRDEGTVLLSDHSLFINLMLPERDNARFTENLLGSFGATRAWLISDGRLIRYEDFPWSSSESPDPRTALSMIDPAVRALETSGILQEFARKNAALAIGMATIILGAIGALGILRARSRPVAALETTGPLLPDMAGDLGASNRVPDYHVAARELLRRWWRHARKSRDLPSIEAFAEGRFSFEPGAPILRRWIWRFQLKRVARMTLRPPRRLRLAGYRRLSERLGRLDAIGRIR